MNEIKLNPGEILVLRTCNADGTSHGGFQWPMSGPVEAPDWEPTDKCGHGLHGFPWGVGDSMLADESGKWWVVRVSTEPGNYRHGAGELIGKCKFRRGEVVLGGTERCDAVALVARYAPPNTAINWATQQAGDGATQKAGDEATQQAGNWATQQAGNWATQQAGNWATQQAGNGATQTAGKDSVQVGRWYDGVKWCVVCRVVTECEANKPYRFDQGKWVEVK